MTDFGYRLLFLLLDAVARLPFRALYLLSDLIYLITFHIVRYRRHVVVKNINDSFPEKTPAERATIVRGFYRHFADQIVETIKLAHVSDDEMKSRMQFEGIEIIDSLMASGRNITAYFSHCGNWEWAPSVTLWSSFKAGENAWFCQVYRPLRNKHFDKYFLRLRSRFNPLSFPKATVFRDLIRLRMTKLPSITGFMSDQKPSHGDTDHHIVMFLNHPTAVITGTETLSRRLDNAVVYWDMHRLSRGHYKIVVRLITDNISSLPPMAVTDKYINLLTRTIERDPSIWLWSHKRWKHPVTLPSANE